MKYTYFLIIALIFTSCRKDFNFQNFDYKTYNRVVGPNGGTVNFYANYNNDSKNAAIVNLNVPAASLDSLLVFNMYQLENYELIKQLEDGFAKFGSKLLYFVPFYESEGYNERGQMETNYHLSVEFHKPITVTYYPIAEYSELQLKNWQEVELYEDYYKSTNKSYKVYKIKIPKIDEWGENNNIFVKLTGQGYPNGYDPTDLSYIVNGRWTATDEWGKGEISMENWEEVDSTEISTTEDKITFKIYDTDHIYVVARDMFLKNIPSVLTTYIGTYFSSLNIKRAAFDEEYYRLFLSDNSVAIFDKYRNFQYRLVDDLTSANLPSTIQSYLKINYSNKVLKVSLKDMGTYQLWEVILDSGVTLTFNGSTVPPVIIYQYDYNPNYLTDTIRTYIQTNYPRQIITNVVYSSQYNYLQYIVYLSSNIRLYFDASSTLLKTYYYKLSSSNLPEPIYTDIMKRVPNAIFSEINLTVMANGSSTYYIKLIDDKTFTYNSKGVLSKYLYPNFPESDLPAEVKRTLTQSYSKNIITNITYLYSYNIEATTQYYEIYFSDLSSVAIDPKGNIL